MVIRTSITLAERRDAIHHRAETRLVKERLENRHAGDVKENGIANAPGRLEIVKRAIQLPKADVQDDERLVRDKRLAALLSHFGQQSPSFIGVPGDAVCIAEIAER